MTATTCPCCGKALRPSTTPVYAPREPGTGIPVAGWTYTGNLIAVARRYAVVDPVAKNFVFGADDPERIARSERRLYSVHVWDGNTYLRKHGHFCSDKCAGEYGRRAYAAAITRHGRRI